MSKRVSIFIIVISLLSMVCAICGLIFSYIAVYKVDKDVKSDIVESTEEKADETSTQYVMYVGTNDKDTYKPEYTQDEAKQIVDEICLAHFDGYTIQEATGSWMDEKNNITHEYTIVCYFDGADIDTVHKAADEIIKKLNQNTVLIEESNIKMDYYSGQ